MDIATVIGFIMGIGLVLGSIAVGGSLLPFIDVPSVMITVGGSIAATLINFPLQKVIGVFTIVKKCFFSTLPTSKEVIQQFMDFASTARRDGLLALENEIEKLNDDFLIRGLEMVIGGSSKEEITAIMETEISYIEQRHATGKKMLDSIGAAAPAFGMIGTLIGLVQMLRTLDDPSKIGGGMATALLTTLYGAVVANLFCIPMAGKLESRSQEELMIRELMLSGLISLVEGHAPRVVQERLVSFLSPSTRPEKNAQAA